MGEPTRLRLVLFRLGSLTCAAPATAVREVVGADRATRIPGCDQTVAGLVNLRGSLLTVVDGRRLVGIEPNGQVAESILVLARGERSVGFLVDEVLDLIEVSADQLETGESLPGVDPGLIAAVGRSAEGLFAVLDTEALVTPLIG
jgi:purine-binding chemotaxis protein CheW